MKLSNLALLFAISASTSAAFVPAASAAKFAASLSATVEATTELVPPKSIPDLIKTDGAVMDLYDHNVQKTYG